MKSLKSQADLAINGAKPAFAEPLHVGRPNVGSRNHFFATANKIFDRVWLTNDGCVVRELEDRIANYHQVDHCIATCSGTAALEIAIRALELKGQVILPSFTFAATAQVIQWLGLTPVFADIDPLTHCVDPHSVRAVLTPHTTAILGVHLWGRACDVHELQRVAEENNVQLFFDAAHGFGCSLGEQMIGNFGQCEAISFHATKLFNTFEGGAVLTNNAELAHRLRLYRNFGFAGIDNVIGPGINAKMHEISAAMGLSNLAIVDSLIEGNKRNFRSYSAGLEDLSGISVLQEPRGSSWNYHYVVLMIDKECRKSRDELAQVLHAENIYARKYFWPGCHRMPHFVLQSNATAGSATLYHTEQVAESVLVLPTGQAIGENEVATICRIIKLAVSE